MVEHFFRCRTRKFCFCFDPSWLSALLILALLTIFFGILGFILVVLTSLRGSVSGVSLYSVFPAHTAAAVVESVIFVGMGVTLWVGLCMENIDLMTIYPWGLAIGGYTVAIWYFIVMISEGESVIQAMLWGQHGRDSKLAYVQAIHRFVYYGSMSVHITLLLFVTTYFPIWSLSFIEQMMFDKGIIG